MKVGRLASLVLALALSGAAATSICRAQAGIAIPPMRHPGNGQIFYFVLTDRFENGSADNDRGGSTFTDPAFTGFDPTALYYYHGGDFLGLSEHLDYIKNLGATAIWITPPFRNKPVQGTSAAYHGYWITDFLTVDPHLGTDADFRSLLASAHARGLKFYLDIVVNHSADVINASRSQPYLSRSTSPYRTSMGVAFNDRDYAYNGLGSAVFPALSATASFPYAPTVAASETLKSPDFLNDVTNYHNRGDDTYSGEDFNYGDFSGLDDLFTEKPAVVNGFIDVYSHWITAYDIDGYRIDTAKHVNPEFWQAFAPAIRQAAADRNLPAFFHFGEVYGGDPTAASAWTTQAGLDSVLNFGFAFNARDFISRALGNSTLVSLFDADDRYTDHCRNAHMLVTFLGNHDLGRFGYFLRQDNPTATDAQLVSLMELGHGLMYLARGEPVVYYGDEQGMVGGNSGTDVWAREDMFATRVSGYAGLTRIGTSQTGAVAKFSEDHPLFKFFQALAALRTAHPSLASGAMMVRTTAVSSVFAFSRIDRNLQREYLVVLNSGRTGTQSVSIPTSQPAGATLRRVFDSTNPTDPGTQVLTAGTNGQVTMQLGALQFTVWQADAALPSTVPAPVISFAAPAAGSTLTFSDQTIEGQPFVTRVELRANLATPPDYTEVTFALARSDRPGQYQLLGVDDAPPYRVYWSPPDDLAPNTAFDLIATADNRRGGRASVQLTGVTWTGSSLTHHGIAGSTTPNFTTRPVSATVGTDASFTLNSVATGTKRLYYQWYKDGALLSGATAATLTIDRFAAADEGQYTVSARNLAGTSVTAPAVLTLDRSGAPTITQSPVGATVPPGRTVRFTVTANSTLPLGYQWLKNGAPLSGATNSSLVLDSLTADDAGNYQAVVTAGGVSVTSASAWLVVGSPTPSRLVNLSVRSTAASGDQTLIAGFVINGVGPKSILIRAVGPTLQRYGVSDALLDPALKIFDGHQTQIASNDDWGGDRTLTAIFAARGAAALPAGSADAAALVSLNAGVYTTHVVGVQGTSGVALIEMYDDDSMQARLVNMSARSQVGKGDEVLIAGFVVGGAGTERVLIRGVGPTLASLFGLSGALADPRLTVRPLGQTTVVASNQGWQGDATLRTAFAQTGAFSLPVTSTDAALIVSLPAGPYTATLDSISGSTGVGLIEVYELP